MKVFLILTISCIILAMCHGHCVVMPPKLIKKDGKLVKPDSCIDVVDKSKHAFGSEWKKGKCGTCTCDGEGKIECCFSPPCNN